MKKIIILFILAIILFTGCHEFTNPVDPYMGLVAYYPLEGNGNNSADVINNASIKSAELSAGHFDDVDSAYTLSGSESYIDCGLIGELSLENTQMSISLWFKQSEAQTNTDNMIGRWADGAGVGYYVDFNNNMPRFELEVENTSTDLSVSASRSYQDSQWHHLVITGYVFMVGSTEWTEIQMYIDGVLIGSDSTDNEPESNAFSPLLIGALNPNDLEWAGAVDNIRVYNRVLTALDVQKLLLETEEGGTDFDMSTLVKAVSSGSTHSLFLKNNGEVWTVGSDSYGQLGLTTTARMTAPTKIPTLSDITAVEAGTNFSVALKDDGKIYGWGLNTSHQLGLDTDVTNKNVPILIPGLPVIVKIAAGNSACLALDENGAVWKWGSNLADKPEQIPGITGALDISSGADHYLILKSDNTIAAFGANNWGQLGNNSSVSSLSVPVAVQDLTDVTAVSAGYLYSMALKSDGTVWCWGDNGAGQFGIGTTANSLVPVKAGTNTAVSVSDVKAISAVNRTSIVLKTDGTLWSWGSNAYGMLGNSDTDESRTYAGKVSINAAISSLGDSNGSQGYSRFGVTSDGEVFAWGLNSNYQLGLGNSTSPATTEYVPIF